MVEISAEGRASRVDSDSECWLDCQDQLVSKMVMEAKSRTPRSLTITMRCVTDSTSDNEHRTHKGSRGKPFKAPSICSADIGVVVGVA